ncbi:DUF5011 domain-containing protein [Glaciecola sp. XM2]|uniref:immunoglobulin-like domain-containing protein n=1 Tax=Glaciecola sp. XM2 TaxID=1914931 RepID=UPI001BDED3A4|nr:DUF5011 domain-containing protein [Glaciecola sp. XM2]
MPDTTPPSLLLLGSPSITLEYGDTFTDPGATATDNVDGVLEVTVTQPNLEQLGVQLIVYQAIDAAGNAATLARELTIVDTTPPVITLMGAQSMTLEYGDTFTDPGATATDLANGAIEVTATSPNLEQLGAQVIVYEATDANGNAATLSRELVIQDTTPPAITIVGAASITIELGETYFDDGATATDNFDDTIEVDVDLTQINADQLGEYEVLYTAIDSSGNFTSVARTLIVEPVPVFTIRLDWTPPEFRQDGAPLDVNDITAYKVYMGSDDENMDVVATVNQSDITTTDIEDLNRGVYFISISAVDHNDLESPISDPVRTIL